MADRQSFRKGLYLAGIFLGGIILSACGGSSGSAPVSSAAAPPSAPPVPVVATPTDPCATSAGLQLAYRTGRIADAVEPSALVSEISKDITCSANALNPAKRALFGLDGDGLPTSDSLRNLVWNPTHDAAILDAADMGAVVLRSNAVFVDGYTVRNEGLAVAAQVGEARTLVLGSHPMRNGYRGGEAALRRTREL